MNFNINRLKRFFIRYGFIISVLCFLWTGAYANASTQNDSITSVRIIKDTLEALPNCLHYRVVGACFWRVCEGWFCWIESTAKLDHYLPDAVVTVFNKGDGADHAAQTDSDNPWMFASKMIDPAAYQMGKKAMKAATGSDEIGSGQSHLQSSSDIDNKFKEVDVIGNPALLLLSKYSDLLLGSTATPYIPYYSSLLDMYAWRYPLLEKLAPGFSIPGLHEVGTFLLHDWGQVYPRNGFIAQPNDAKAAAVIALRATHIVTRPGQPHLYHFLSDSCGDHCHTYAVKENSQESEFQIIYPFVKNACIVFGKSDITSLHPWGMEAYRKGHGRYVWVLWRHYHGCVQDDGGHYIGSINF